MAIALICFSLSLVFLMGNLCEPTNTIFRVTFVLFNYVFSLLLLASNAYFIPEVFPSDHGMKYLGLTIIGVWVLTSAVVTLILYAEVILKRGEVSLRGRAVLLIFTLFSFFDPTFFRLLTSEKVSTDRINSLRLANGYFLYLPFFALNIYTLRVYTSPDLLLRIFLNALALLLLLAFELVQWIGNRGTTRVPPPLRVSPLHIPFLSESRNPLLNESPESVDVDGHPGPLNEERPEPPVGMVSVSSGLSLPVFLLVVVSLIPQACSIVGLPFCSAMIKRYWLSVKGKATFGQGRLTWFESRGYFLILVNIVSFSLVCLIVFFVITIPAMCLLLLHKMKRNEVSPMSQSFHAFRKEIQNLMSCLWFTYFPFLNSPPLIQLDNQSLASLTWWKVVGAYLWVVLFEFGLPIADVVTDVLYSKSLLVAYGDPLLAENNEKLYRSMIVSFISTGLGIVILATAYFFEFLHVIKKDFKLRIEMLIVNLSPLGVPSLVPRKQHVLRFLSLLVEDIPQLVVVCGTVSYVGTVSPLWIFKLLLSAASLTGNMSRVSTNFVFGRTITRESRLALLISYVILYGFVFSGIAALLTHDNFCDDNRTVKDLDLLYELSNCSIITGKIVVNRLEEDTTNLSYIFDTSAIMDSFSVTNNDFIIRMDFESMLTLNETFNISNNNRIKLKFNRLETILPQGHLIMSNNADLTIFETPNLHEIQSGASLIFQDNKKPTNSLALDFSGLTNLLGELTVINTEFSVIDFSFLENIGAFGKLSLLANNADYKGTQVSFGSLITSRGPITISNNVNIDTCTFPLVTQNLMSLNVSWNLNLQTLAFPKFNRMAGVINIIGNANLTMIDLSALVQVPGTLVISENSSLERLEFPSLVCSLPVNIVVTNNVNLKTIVISQSCPELILVSGTHSDFQYDFNTTSVRDMGGVYYFQ